MPLDTRLHLGAAYYPEHWPEERWPVDIHLMREAGLTVVRLAEFAWSSLEPAPGQFNFDWLERAIGLLAESNIAVVLATPTAAPPAWLSTRAVLAVDEQGRPVQFGNRSHYCVNSPDFQAAAQRIAGAMAARFGPNPHIIGWQLDNEYQRVCYCERCRTKFQQYLQQKFGDLDNLNTHWATAYWSQTYFDWVQIPVPIGPHNPGLVLEFKRFVSHSYRAFQQLQIEAVRPHLRPEVWLTHNFMGWFEGIDGYSLSADLDLASLDWTIGQGHHDYLSSGAIHDLVRGFKRRNFWLMETQPGHVNWARVNNSLHKGEAAAMAWHAVAHGADAVLYWQWRAALGGQEQYHGTLLDQAGQPRPFYTEVRQLSSQFAKVSELLAGSEIKAQVALLNVYDNRWAIQAQRHHQDFDEVAHFNHYYRPLAARNITADIISADAPLDGYKLVIAPALHLLNAERAARLMEFVRQGGHLVLTIRSGMKDDFNALLPLRQPGPLAEATGVEVEEYYALPEPVPVHSTWFTGTTHIWAERLKVLDRTGTEVLARFGVSNGWLDGQPAITTHLYGQGRVYYVGVYLNDPAQFTLLDNILRRAGIQPFLITPTGVEARCRVTPSGQEIFIVINHERTEKLVSLPWAGQDHLSNRHIERELVLPPYGTAVLTRAVQWSYSI